jgi:hypothetical protein
MGSGGTGTGTAGDVAGGAGTAGCGLADSRTGSGSGSSGGGAGWGSFACRVSGNFRVAFIGTLDSGRFENTDRSVLGLVFGGRRVIARLLLAEGLIGRTYWYTT